MLEIIVRFQAAAGHKGVGDADRGGIAERRSDIELIILLQKGTVNDVEDVVLMVVPVFVRQPRGDLLQLVREAVRAGDLKAVLQRRRHRVPVFLPILPEVRVQALFILPARVGHIEHIAQGGLALAVVNENDALGAAPDVPAHPLVPEVPLRAGGGFGPLGVDHQLLREGIFVDTAHHA